MLSTAIADVDEHGRADCALPFNELTPIGTTGRLTLLLTTDRIQPCVVQGMLQITLTPAELAALELEIHALRNEEQAGVLDTAAPSS